MVSRLLHVVRFRNDGARDQRVGNVPAQPPTTLGRRCFRLGPVRAALFGRLGGIVTAGTIAVLLFAGVLNAQNPVGPVSAKSWRPLFDGKTLNGWNVTRFGGEGEVYVNEGRLMLDFGNSMTGVTYAGNELPSTDYELQLEAQRIEGTDFFCGLTFPVNDQHLTLIVGGWGGALVGLSSLDDEDAAHNETSQSMAFRKGRWYRVHLQVTQDRVRVSIDDKPVINQSLNGRELSIRPEVELCTPLGICAWQTSAAIRKLRIRQLPGKAEPVDKGS